MTSAARATTMTGAWASEIDLLPSVPAAGTPFIAEMLADQADMTAVERFAQFHEDADGHLQGRYYTALMPARMPRPGEQLAFEVELDRCSGCKACVAACHALNGLDDAEAWRDVGLIVGGSPGLPVLQHVTSSCHHCLDPACLSACPVDAYEKDPVTGIVKHLDDQCFGCQYCTLACPYDAPKFHAGKGIVRKCDMCSDRLAAGEAPACVAACPSEAIRIRVVSVHEVARSAAANEFLPAAPAPDYTRPTTRYLGGRNLPAGLHAADHHRIAPEHAHGPLVAMLVLTQASVGSFALHAAGAGGRALPAVAFVLGMLGLAASTLHLGRPLLAYRALIGLRHSWLSREVAAFGAYAGLLSSYVALQLLRPSWLAGREGLMTGLAAATVVAGFAGVASSVLVYHVVRRPFWRASTGGVKFAGTGFVLGAASALLAETWSAAIASAGLRNELARGLGLALAAGVTLKLLAEASILRHLRDVELTPLRRSAELVRGALSRLAVMRLGLGVLGGVLIPLALAMAGSGASPAVWAAYSAVATAAVLGGELAERTIFFAAVAKPKMPGGVMS